MKTAGQSKREKVKVCFIGVQNFIRFPETRRMQQICRRTFVSCVCDLSHSVIC